MNLEKQRNSDRCEDEKQAAPSTALQNLFTYQTCNSVLKLLQILMLNHQQMSACELYKCPSVLLVFRVEVVSAYVCLYQFLQHFSLQWKSSHQQRSQERRWWTVNGPRHQKKIQMVSLINFQLLPYVHGMERIPLIVACTLLASLSLDVPKLRHWVRKT